MYVYNISIKLISRAELPDMIQTYWWYTMTTNTWSWIASGCWATAAALNFVSYAITPEVKNISLIKEDAKMVQEYSGSNPSEALDHAIERIQLVTEDNPAYSAEITELKSYVTSARDSLTDTSEISSAAQLTAAADKMSTFADGHTKSGLKLAIGGLDVMLCGMNAATAIVSSSRDERKYDNAIKHATRSDNDIWHNYDN
jgi:hypothetical protein